MNTSTQKVNVKLIIIVVVCISAALLALGLGLGLGFKKKKTNGNLFHTLAPGHMTPTYTHTPTAHNACASAAGKCFPALESDMTPETYALDRNGCCAIADQNACDLKKGTKASWSSQCEAQKSAGACAHWADCAWADGKCAEIPYTYACLWEGAGQTAVGASAWTGGKSCKFNEKDAAYCSVAPSSSPCFTQAQCEVIKDPLNCDTFPLRGCIWK